MKKQSGLVLIELITVIVLVGIIATFTGYFLYTGINGYINAKNNAQGALNAQAALDRIALELRNMNELDQAPVISATGDSSIKYTSADALLTGTRTIKYDAGANTIFLATDADYPLLENVSSFNLSVSYKDLNNEGTNDDVESIAVGFKVHEIGKEFKTHVFPRHMVKKIN